MSDLCLGDKSRDRSEFQNEVVVMFEKALEKQEVGACQPRLNGSWGLELLGTDLGSRSKSMTKRGIQ
jgi:hypothetical protein